MYGLRACMNVLLVLVLLQPSALHGQGLRQRPQSMPNSWPGKTIIDPREQRLLRERAVAFVGPRGRDFVETYGEDAAVAILACSQPMARQLVEFYISGGLDTLPQPRLLLRVIAQPRHGNEVAAWAITNVKELSDTDRFNAYLSDPLTYALALKKLDDGVAEVRENRKRAQDYYTALANAQAVRSANGWRMFALGVGVTVVFLLIIWRLRELSGQNVTWF